MKIMEIIKTKTPDQMRIDQLKATKERANTALKNERDRQKRNKAVQTLAGITSNN